MSKYPAKLKELGLNFLVSLTSTILTLLVLEVVFVVFEIAPLPETYSGRTHQDVPSGRIECMNPKVTRPYFFKPGVKYPGCVYISVGYKGFRNAEPVPIETTPDQIRILAVGDSFTFGYGVMEEDTYIYRLQKNLHQNTGKNVLVLNAAVPGSDLPKYLEQIRRPEERLNPHLILVGLHLNDIMNYPTSLIIEKVAQHFDWKIRKFSRVLNYCLYQLERKLSAPINIKMMLNTYTPERRKIFLDFIHEVKTITSQKKAKLFFAVYPIFYDFQNYAFHDVHRDIAEILTQEKIPFVDFLSEFENANAEDYWITKNDQHPNELANDIFLKKVEKPIQDIVESVSK
jgi:lysophospholipase L1-like esterase